MENDIYTRITNQLVSAIEQGAEDYRMPWHASECAFLPVNAGSGLPYRGINVLCLWAAAARFGYQSNRLATFRQWQRLGGQVRSGERATLIVFWKFFDNSSDEDEMQSKKSRRSVLARGYPVFNGDQVDGAPAPEAMPAVRDDAAERFFAAVGPTICPGPMAAYDPSDDRIVMPPFSLFRDGETYYATLSHEV